MLTEASLLLINDEIASSTQRVILNEMVRFLSHPSAGVKQFDQMPQSWPDIVNTVQAGGAIPANSTQTEETIGAWHQEVRDLSLVLSRQLAREVTVRTSRAHAADASVRQKDDAQRFASDCNLRATFSIPDAAAPLDVTADLQRRSISVSMKVKAPEDRRSTKARANWLIRQLPADAAPDVHVRIFWPGRAVATQHTADAIRADPSVAVAAHPGVVASSFELLLVRNLGARFGSRKRFIVELETAVPDFYEQVGQHLKVSTSEQN